MVKPEPLFQITPLNDDGDFVEDAKTGEIIANAGVSYRPTPSVNEEVLRLVAKLDNASVTELYATLANAKIEEESAKQMLIMKQTLTRICDSAIIQRLNSLTRKERKRTTGYLSLGSKVRGIRSVTGQETKKERVIKTKGVDFLTKLADELLKNGINQEMIAMLQKAAMKR